jgi:hypothetical protein
MSLHEGAGDDVDWPEMEQSWGVKFPDDYRGFMRIYGHGGIEDAFSIAAMDTMEHPDSASSVARETANARGLWEPAPAPRGAGTGPHPVIAWGVTVGADIVCWNVKDADPNRWGTAVWRRHAHPHWEFHKCGMVEFLILLLSRGFSECPLSDASLWGAAPVKFLHWREEGRLVREGIDPWTGEPDPYAGMFGPTED